MMYVTACYPVGTTISKTSSLFTALLQHYYCMLLLPLYVLLCVLSPCFITTGGRQSKHSYQTTNADQKSLESMFSIAICRHTGDKWQSKTLFLTIFDLRSSIVLMFSIAAHPVCLWWVYWRPPSLAFILLRNRKLIALYLLL